MALYGVRLVINLFDLCIYRRYLEEFIGNRKTSMEFSVLLLIVCELIGSAVNQMGISWLNFVTMVAILCVSFFSTAAVSPSAEFAGTVMISATSACRIVRCSEIGRAHV